MAEAKLRVVVVGQTPPPFHGQAIAIESFLQGSYERIEPLHVPMAFSRRVEEVGRVRLGKVLQLPWLVGRILWARVRHRAQVLYYPPYAVAPVPLVRDLVVLICCRWAFRWTVFHLHATGTTDAYLRLGRLGRLAFRSAYHRPDVVIVPSQVGEREGRDLLARHVSIVPNGVADDAVRVPTVARVGPAEPVVLYAGVLRASKGIPVLLEACARLKADGVRFRLELMGEFQPAGFEREVTARVHQLGLSSDVDVLGRRVGNDKWERFRRADVFCLPTLYDNFPLSVLEAMEFELPVVATRCGALGEIVVEGETGYLVDPGDDASLASRLEKLLLDAELRTAMGAAGRERYAGLFTVEQYRRKLEDALCRVIEG
jgi:glycosyltransferase involved in cell wall biosynthesis